MNIYKIYVATKKKDGTVTKYESIPVQEVDAAKAIEKAIWQAKTRHGFKGKVHILSVLISQPDKSYVKLEIPEKYISTFKPTTK